MQGRKSFQYVSNEAMEYLRATRSGKYSPKQIVGKKMEFEDQLTKAAKTEIQQGNRASYAATRKRLVSALEKAAYNRANDLARAALNDARRYIEDGNFREAASKMGDASKPYRVAGLKTPDRISNDLKKLASSMGSALVASDVSQINMIVERALKTGQALRNNEKYKDALAVYEAALRNAGYRGNPNPAGTIYMPGGNGPKLILSIDNLIEEAKKKGVKLRSSL